MYAGLFLHQPALRMLGRGLGSLGDYIDAFDDHAVFLDESLEYTSLFAAVFAGEHLYGVAFFDMLFAQCLVCVWWHEARLEHLGCQ